MNDRCECGGRCIRPPPFRDAHVPVLCVRIASAFQQTAKRKTMASHANICPLVRGLNSSGIALIPTRAKQFQAEEDGAERLCGAV